MKFLQITDKLFSVLEGRGANGGCYIGETGVLWIDAKMDKESVDETIAEIVNRTDKPVKFLVNTHSDVLNREQVINLLGEMKERQNKVKKLW